jgi:hypothetical protein
MTWMDVPMTRLDVSLWRMERFVADPSGIAPNRRVLALFGSKMAKNGPDLVFFAETGLGR